MKTQVIRILALMFLCATGAQGSMIYTANLTGSAEFPPIASPGTGTAIVTFDDSAYTLRVQVTFSGLIGMTTAAHIHASTAAAGTGNAGVATMLPSFSGFPLGVSSGTYDTTFDLSSTSSYSPAFLTASGGTTAGAAAGLKGAFDGGRAYLNIHSTFAPGGEIRGFPSPTAVPEAAATAPLLAFSLVAMGVMVRRRHVCGV